MTTQPVRPRRIPFRLEVLSGEAVEVVRRTFGRCPSPVVAHVFSAWGAALAATAGAGSVTVVHDCRPLPGPPGAAADHVLVGSHAEAEAVTGPSRPSVDVIARAVDQRRWNPDGPTAPRGEAPRLLVTSALCPGDGTDTAIAALSGIPGAELVVAGPTGSPLPAHRAEIRRLLDAAAALDVADRVRVVTGPTPELVRSADIVLHVPWSTMPPDPVLHAMACAVPVVAATTGALPETVLDGVTGALVAPRDPAALARTVRRLLADRSRCAALSAAALDRVHLRHSWAQVATDIHHVYRRLARS
ncbi:hypothetical protein GCM10022243_37460 [Saccharothrix violaceirubra]|uniref:Glycosyltransferase involved in cell wall biosynthesis n=1 Tax=Saccharothrix violaceirubra TaxID=413306 RepID=A0A7W7T4C9_9PSEU|nr:glycosyltransferase family 4 protein [Saccharothrix violaceirubra]MBB4966338.1 glycosyltransferase involved in cell wall biosynthesis [Saccharothrix violaceirubra]